MDEFHKHNWAGFTYPTGYMRSLFEYTLEHPFKSGLEVGFDAGCSAIALLRACPEARLFSVDIGECQHGQSLMREAEKEVQLRHSFLQADSRVHLPAIKGLLYDMIYIDGDHLYDAVKQDLFNADELLAPGGYMIVDDANPNHQHFGVGRAVEEFMITRGYAKWELPGSPSEAVVLRRI